MDLREFARQRLEGIPTNEHGPYTRAINSAHRRFATVEEVKAASDEQLRECNGTGLGSLEYLRELVGDDGQRPAPPPRVLPTRGKDQTVRPSWAYDESHHTICGRKSRTGGKVTVASLYFRDRDNDRLYYPLTEQADALGRGLATMLNERPVLIPDSR